MLGRGCWGWDRRESTSGGGGSIYWVWVFASYSKQLVLCLFVESVINNEQGLMFIFQVSLASNVSYISCGCNTAALNIALDPRFGPRAGFRIPTVSFAPLISSDNVTLSLKSVFLVNLARLQTLLEEGVITHLLFLKISKCCTWHFVFVFVFLFLSSP